MPYTVILKRNEEKRIAAGHPWVYANEVARIEGKDANGSVAVVRDASGRFLGKGFINHLSKILVRILTRREEEIDREFFLNRIREAAEYRKKLGFSDSCRLVFAEADGLPALIVDKYHDILCAQFLSLGMDQRKDMICGCLKELFSPRGIYERSDVAVRAKEGLKPVKGWILPPCPGTVPEKSGDTGAKSEDSDSTDADTGKKSEDSECTGADTVVEIEENGLIMRVDLENGQKTGYFLDQKENRFALRRYAAGAEVLDCFSNVGGFSVNAAAAGAKSVLAVDISRTALDEVEKNAARNGFSEIVSTLCGDVFEVLREFKKNGRSFDLVVLDPPAFCKSASEVRDACRGYKDINVLGLKLVKPGGFLVTSSCSHYLTFPLFERMLSDAARDSGRIVRTVELRAQSPDHPSLLAAEETQYLKFVVLHVK